jgi:hypothetical protein
LSPKAVRLLLAVGIVLLAVASSAPLSAQDAAPATPSESAQSTPPALVAATQPTQPDPTQPPFLTAPLAPPSTERPVSWVKLPLNLMQDQKAIWLFPISLVEGHHWKPLLVFTGVTAGLVGGLDTQSGRFFQTTQNYKEFNSIFRDSHTASALFAFPVAFYGGGFIRRDSYAEHTVELAGEAALDSTIVDLVMKDITRRTQPDQVPLGGNFADTWFQEHGKVLGGIGSFPSGHEIAAMSIATVFADRYPKYKWEAYGLAAFVGFTRLSVQAHNPSDVFAGAFLGYVIAHYTVEHLH